VPGAGGVNTILILGGKEGFECVFYSIGEVDAQQSRLVI
jgi:hypothetical protein